MSKVTFDPHFEIALVAGSYARHNTSGATGHDPEWENDQVILRNASVGPRVIRRLADLPSQCADEAELRAMLRRELTPCPRLAHSLLFAEGAC